MLKLFNYVIDKNDVSMDIQAYRSVLSTQPERLIVDKTGITNVGMMNVRKDVEDGSFWNTFLD